MKLWHKAAAFTVAVLSTSALISQVEHKAEQKATQSQRYPQFENPAVKVWRTLILPNQPLALHHHDHPRIIVALTGGTINIVDSSGAKETQHWETGKAYWLPANAPNTTHADVNAGTKPMEVMVVELEKEQ